LASSKFVCSLSAGEWTKIDRRSNFVALANAIFDAETKYSPVSPFPS
jgi:hypothetical protein